MAARRIEMKKLRASGRSDAVDDKKMGHDMLWETGEGTA